jgi:hypothetical protein
MQHMIFFRSSCDRTRRRWWWFGSRSSGGPLAILGSWNSGAFLFRDPPPIIKVILFMVPGDWQGRAVAKGGGSDTAVPNGQPQGMQNSATTSSSCTIVTSSYVHILIFFPYGTNWNNYSTDNINSFVGRETNTVLHLVLWSMASQVQ